MLINPHQCPLPLEWSTLFQEPKPLAVEIGFGNGAFLETLQKTYNAVGFEVSLVSVEKALSRLHSPTCALIHMDGVWGVRELFSPQTLDAIFINFPLPWPKKKHLNRRLMTPTKLQVYASRLQNGGKVLLHTDCLDYAQQSLESVQSSGLFTVESFDILKDAKLGTKYENKWLLQGKTIYRLAVRKIKHIDVPFYIKEANMPHVIVSTVERPPVSATYRTKAGTIRVADVYGNASRWLLACFTCDDDFIGVPLEQRVYVAVHPHREGYIVKIHNADNVFKTENVKTLLWQVACQIGPIKRANFEPLQVEQELG